MPLERLFPDGPAQTTPDEAVSGLELADRVPAGRPYLALNMVSTADGKAAVDGRTRAISSDADRQMFHHLRTQFDAVMVGAGTVRAERYGALTKSAELRAKREREGVLPEALAVIVSGSLSLPPDVPLLQDPAARVVIMTRERGELAGVRAEVDYMRSPAGPLDLGALLAGLRREHGVRSVLCEGGPTLNASLLSQGLVDELFLTLSPSIAGGKDALTIVEGAPLPRLAGLELLSALRAGDELFLRYRLSR